MPLMPRRPRAAIASLALLLVTAPAVAADVCPCLGDIDGNGTVDGADLAFVLGAWGPCANCDADLSENGTVDGLDLGILLGAWGPCSPIPDNDTCGNAKLITSFTGSANSFCTFNANTDGPAVSGCDEPAFSTIEGDVWFRIEAPQTCTLQIGVCADFDVRIAAYSNLFTGGCTCPGGFGGLLLECASTLPYPSCAKGAAMLIPVGVGDCILLRVGGAPNQRGKGNVDINIYLPPCTITSSTTLSATGLDAGTEFGLNCDMSGDVAVVGAIFDDLTFGGSNAGSARVYRYDGVTWNPETTLTGPEPFPGQRFGIDTAVDGTRIIVGAGTVDADCDSDPLCDTGAAFVYEYDGSQWEHVDTLLPSVSSGSDGFGGRVGISGSRAIVGASDDDQLGVNAGAAYVYERIVFLGTPIWLLSEKLVASDGDFADGFGLDVAIDGARAVVGAYNDEGGGSIYVFEDTGSDWVQVAKLQPAGLPSTSDFGYSVAIDGDRIAVGAPDFNGTGTGRVFVYERFGALGWLLAETLTGSDTAADASFGTSVALHDTQLLVGATNAGVAPGAAYLFWRVSGGWIERGKLVGSAANANDSFGGSVAIDDGRGFVGAYFDDVGLSIDRGSVYRFNGLGECTGNGVPDACDIANGTRDSDGDGVPNACEP
jgi:hypothetical protein